MMKKKKSPRTTLHACSRCSWKTSFSGSVAAFISKTILGVVKAPKKFWGNLFRYVHKIMSPLVCTTISLNLLAFRCRISYFTVVKKTGSVLSGVWKEEHIRSNATDHTWVPLTNLQMKVYLHFLLAPSTLYKFTNMKLCHM